MADINPLANRLQRSAGINAPQYHELIFNFPATELLLEGTRPHLEAPTDVVYREKPGVEDYHPDPSDLDFFRVFKIQQRHGAASTAPADPQPNDLVTAVKRLKAAPGNTRLDIVAFREGDETVYRIRMTTIWRLTSGNKTEVKGVQYDEME